MNCKFSARKERHRRDRERERMSASLIFALNCCLSLFLSFTPTLCLCLELICLPSCACVPLPSLSLSLTAVPLTHFIAPHAALLALLLLISVFLLLLPSSTLVDWRFPSPTPPLHQSCPPVSPWAQQQQLGFVCDRRRRKGSGSGVGCTGCAGERRATTAAAERRGVRRRREADAGVPVLQSSADGEEQRERRCSFSHQTSIPRPVSVSLCQDIASDLCSQGLKEESREGSSVLLDPSHAVRLLASAVM